MDFVLASTSTYRKQLLNRLGLDFRCVAPQVEEALIEGELPGDRANRLAHAKAKEVHNRNPTSWVLGSDQVAALGEDILRKPGNATTAVRQLERSSGNTVMFHTAAAMIGPGSSEVWHHEEPTKVFFRQLTAEEITAYLEFDSPYDCAGSFKVESLGISLFEKIQGNDPTALEGLPLIAISFALRKFGINIV